MTNKLPVFSDKHKICIICEGSEQYEEIKRKINEFHGVDDTADEVVIYGNPCTMQIILEHWTDVKLKTSAKKVNAPLIKEFTGVEDYRGKKEQRKEIMEHITAENYNDMCIRISQMDDNDTKIGSSNLGRFMAFLEEDDVEWIEMINKKLDL